MKKKLLALILVVCVIFTGCGVVGIVDATSRKVSNYTINAILDYNGKTLQATEKLDYLNNTETNLTFLLFHLYPNAFREGATIYKATNSTQNSRAYPNGFSEGRIDIEEVRVNGDKVKHEIRGEDQNLLHVPLNSTLHQNSWASVEIIFSLVIPNINHRFGYGAHTLNLGNWYPIVCVYEKGEGFATDGYSPNGDPFYSDIANYNVTLKYPSNLVLASTGNCVFEDKSTGLATSGYQALAVRDFAMVLSEEFQLKSQTVGKTTVNYYYYNDNEPDKHLKTAVDALNTFNAMIGEYPYAVLNVVKANFLQGGMEYPNLVYIADTVDVGSEYDNVIIHEIAHQWFYGVVGNNECEYAWMDEGLVEYVTALFYSKNEGYELDTKTVLGNALSAYLLFCDVYEEVYGHLDTSMNRNVHNFNTETEYVYLTYVKGVLMFDSISDIIGDSKMEKCIRTYYQRNAMKNATPADMIQAFESVAGRKLGSFMMSWLDGSVVLEGLSGY